jgi:hypothetical protein
MRILSFDIGIRNLSYCIVSIPSEKEVILWSDIFIENWENIDIFVSNGSEVKNSKKVNIERVIDLLIETLNSRKDIFTAKQIDLVIIERQMRVAPRNLMLSSALLMYFKLLHYKCELIAASHKLQLEIHPVFFTGFNKNELVTQFCYEKDKNKSASTNKTRRKQVAVQMCKYVTERIGNHQMWLQKLDGGLKKDDLSDCLLQCLRHVQSSSTTKLKRMNKKRNRKCLK